MPYNLSIKTQGIQGKDTHWKERIGYVAIFGKNRNNPIITVDNFKGAGQSYKQRDTPIIIISNDNGVYRQFTEEQLLKALNLIT